MEIIRKMVILLQYIKSKIGMHLMPRTEYINIKYNLT